MKKPINSTIHLDATIKPLGVGVHDDSAFVYCFDTASSSLHMYKQTNNYTLHKAIKETLIHDINGKTADITHLSSMNISNMRDMPILTYVKTTKDEHALSIAISHDLFSWKTLSHIEGVTDGMVVSNYTYQKQYVMYTGGPKIEVGFSRNMEKWHFEDITTKQPPYHGTAAIHVNILGIFVNNEGILVISSKRTTVEGDTMYVLDAALFDKENPKEMLWHLDSFWKEPVEWIDKKVHPLGAVFLNGDITSYWYIKGEGIYPILHPLFSNINKPHEGISFLILNKYHKNPILTPNPKNYWESQATFNPTAIHDQGKTHLVYRAVGEKYISVLGYATSSDGLTIDERFDTPMYSPRAPFEGGDGFAYYGKSSYASGPGWGGCEDPRLTKIGNTVFMTYVAFDGWNPPRVALTSISLEDFRNRNWDKWALPRLISRPGVVDKNAALLPEKINGKYVMFHRIFPDILIDFVDDLDFDGQNTYLKGQYKISPTKTGWDSRKVGTGPSPIKTKEGWLLIYHAVDDKADHEYKMGAMLLDLKDPTKVLVRSSRPILEPREWYENRGHKSGVPYPCGATLVNDTLYVYYGGADSVVCVATANINDFLERLHQSSGPKFQVLSMHNV